MDFPIFKDFRLNLAAASFVTPVTAHCVTCIKRAVSASQMQLRTSNNRVNLVKRIISVDFCPLHKWTWRPFRFRCAEKK